MDTQLTEPPPEKVCSCATSKVCILNYYHKFFCRQSISRVNLYILFLFILSLKSVTSLSRSRTLNQRRLLPNPIGMLAIFSMSVLLETSSNLRIFCLFLQSLSIVKRKETGCGFEFTVIEDDYKAGSSISPVAI